MNFEAVVFNPDDKKCLNDFLRLPKCIYSSEELMQNKSDERSLLCGTHILSKYFKVIPILVYRGKTSVSRAVVTIYPDDADAYIGLFESEEDSAAAKLLFDTAVHVAKENSASEIIGPVDCSFWVKYRLKTNYFGAPYTGEPYNKNYYLKLWEENGFKEYQKYFSNHYIAVENDNGCEKYEERLAGAIRAGYEIKSPSPESFDKTLSEVYSLLIDLYSSFPAYKKITESEFCETFGYLKSILDYSMVKMAYYNKKAVGFFISVPNFGNSVYGKLYPWKIFKIISEKKKPRSYVMLYMGVDREHCGLGKALAESVRTELKKRRVPSVGALIRSGNINKDYMAQLIDFEYEYVLLKKTLI